MPSYTYHCITQALAPGPLPESVTWRSFQVWNIATFYLFKLCFCLMILVLSFGGLSIRPCATLPASHILFSSFYSFSLRVFQTQYFWQPDRSSISLITSSFVSDVLLNWCNNLLDCQLRLTRQWKYKVDFGTNFVFIGLLVL